MPLRASSTPRPSREQESRPGASDPQADPQALLDEHEATVTRSVTSAVTADLKRRFGEDLAQKDANIAALEAEVASLHTDLHEIRLRLHRLNAHPAIRLARALRRALR